MMGGLPRLGAIGMTYRRASSLLSSKFMYLINYYSVNIINWKNRISLHTKKHLKFSKVIEIPYLLYGSYEKV